MATTTARHKDTGRSLHLSKFHHLRLAANPRQTGPDQQGHFTDWETEAETAESTPRSRGWPVLELGVHLRTLDSLQRDRAGHGTLWGRADEPPKTPGGSRPPPPPQPSQEAPGGCSLADPGTRSRGT